MKKRILKIAVITGLIGFFTIMGYTIMHTLQVKAETAEKINQLPPFKFYTLAGAAFTEGNIEEGTPVVIIHFSPDCENCQQEAAELNENIAMLGNALVLMVSEAEKTDVEKFAADYKLNDHAQIIPLLDQDHIFFNVFGAVLNPSVYIYDKEHQLARYYKGQTKVEAIQKAINHEGPVADTN